MFKKYLFVAFCVAALPWFPAGAGAEGQKMYRYTDADGKRFFVILLEDVPPEYRPSASMVVVAKEQSAPNENAAAAETGAANGKNNAVTVLSFSPTPTENRKCGFSGEVKNGMKNKAENVKLHFEVKTADGTKPYDIPVGEGGVMNAGETVKVSPVTDVPVDELTGYSYIITWQTTRMDGPPANPAQAAPPKQ